MLNASVRAFIIALWASCGRHSQCTGFNANVLNRVENLSRWGITDFSLVDDNSRSLAATRAGNVDNEVLKNECPPGTHRGSNVSERDISSGPEDSRRLSSSAGGSASDIRRTNQDDNQKWRDMKNDALSSANPKLAPLDQLNKNDPESRLVIGINIRFVKIASLDFLKGMLQMNIHLRLFWYDARLDYDGHAYIGDRWNPFTDAIPIHMDTPGGEEVWVPDMTLSNNMEENMQENTNYYYRGLLFDRTFAKKSGWNVYWSRILITKTRCEVETENYPFDSQECVLAFEPWSFTGVWVDMGNDLFTRPDSDGTEASAAKIPYFDEAFTNKDELYEIYEIAVHTRNRMKGAKMKQTQGLPPSLTNQGLCGKNPCVIYVIRMRRKSHYYVVNFIWPLSLMILLAYVSFWIPFYMYDRVALLVSVLIAVFAIMFITSSVRPPLGHDTWLDVFQAGVIMLCMVPVVESVIVSRLTDFIAKRQATKTRAEEDALHRRQDAYAADVAAAAAIGAIHKAVEDGVIISPQSVENTAGWGSPNSREFRNRLLWGGDSPGGRGRYGRLAYHAAVNDSGLSKTASTQGTSSKCTNTSSINSGEFHHVPTEHVLAPVPVQWSSSGLLSLTQPCTETDHDNYTIKLPGSHTDPMYGQGITTRTPSAEHSSSSITADNHRFSGPFPAKSPSRWDLFRSSSTPRTIVEEETVKNDGSLSENPNSLNSADVGDLDGILGAHTAQEGQEDHPESSVSTQGITEEFTDDVYLLANYIDRFFQLFYPGILLAFFLERFLAVPCQQRRTLTELPSAKMLASFFLCSFCILWIFAIFSQVLLCIPWLRRNAQDPLEDRVTKVNQTLNRLHSPPQAFSEKRRAASPHA